MSRLWPDRLGIALYPERLVLARASGGLHRRMESREIVAFDPAKSGVSPWQPAVDALAAKVAAGALAKANVNLVLSNHFVRYAVIPWSDSLRSQDDELAFARHCFARAYGSEAEGWDIRLSSSKPGKPWLACAVERSLIEELNRCMTPLASRYRSLQPHLMASFNSWNARLTDSPAWLVVAEPGLLCLALLQEGYWQSVRTVTAGADWISELPGVLAREECLVDSETHCDEVLLFAPDAARPMMPEAGRWRISELLPTLLPGMVQGVDAPFSIALGG